ncbi:TetR-like C-terminal domain-containing protein [Streptosporangium sp. NPDC051022]|uniref:TetR-like C-terminal domain-containing protein n=1 Tax=Streptosporangium sp. NPDC051022 TaxID=3155752 RepID=UPI003446D2F8
MMTGLVHAMRTDAHLAETLRSHVADEDRGPFRTIVERAAARGEVPAHTSTQLAHQVAEGQIIRRTILGQPLDHDFLTDLVDNLLVPLLTRTFPTDEETHRTTGRTHRR